MMFFYTGTNQPHWLWKHVGNWFVSANSLRRWKTVLPAQKHWALDSGGFTELSTHGQWTKSAATYAKDIQRYYTEIGQMHWAAPQDWMCEEHILKKTSKSVLDHQLLTITSVLELRQLIGSNLVIPVLQGWEADDYLRHIDMYQKAGFDLVNEPVVGIGSVCRRQNVEPILQTLRRLAEQEKLRIHAFGFKKTGIAAVGHLLHSSDSLAWSYQARYAKIALPGHTHRTCSCCVDYARKWTAELKAQFPCITN